MNVPLLATQVRPPDSDISTPMLKAFQAKALQSQGDLAALQLEQGQERRAALKDFQSTGNVETLRGQPDIMAQAIQNYAGMDELAQKKYARGIERIGAAARTVLPLAGKPGFGEAWAKEMDDLHAGGFIDRQRYDQWRNNPSELALDQILTLSGGIDAYIKRQQLKAGQEFSSATTNYFSGLRQQESSNNPAAKAPVGTSQGLYGFNDATWKGVVDKFPGLGLTADGRGNPIQEERAARALTQDNARQLVDKGIMPTDANLRMAHFLGGPDAVKFLGALQSNPDAPAQQFVSAFAVRDNPTIFSKDGRPATVKEVFQSQAGKYGNSVTAIEGMQTKKSMGGVPGKEMLPFLVASASNPMLGEGQQKVAMELMKHFLPKPSDDLLEYEKYVEQETAAGRVPEDFTPWHRENKRIGAQSLTVDQRGERAAVTGRAQADTEVLKEIQKTYTTALRLQPALARALVAIEEAPAGWSGIVAAQLGKAAGLAGIEVPKGASEAQVLQSITTQLAGLYRLPGPVSDAEMALYLQAAPNLGDSKQANKAKIELFQALMRRAGDIVRVYRENLGAEDLQEKLSKLDETPVFTSEQRAQLQGAAASANKPLSMPFTAAGTVDEKRLEKGKQYDWGEGIHTWTGQGMLPVKAPDGASPQ